VVSFDFSVTHHAADDGTGRLYLGMIAAKYNPDRVDYSAMQSTVYSHPDD